MTTRREFLRHLLFSAGGLSALPLLNACNNGDHSLTRSSMTTGLGFSTLKSEVDANGLRLPEGFVSRVIAQAGMPVADTGTLLPIPFFPDGAATFPDPENPGGWMLLVNSEVPGAAAPLVGGGVQVFRFAADGTLTETYSALSGSDTNCAGGKTPWGTWISCEEVDKGTSFETHPLGEGTFSGVTFPRQLDSLGIFKHEAAAIDAGRKHIYLTEDQSDGCFYRFVADDPRPWDGSVVGDLAAGRLQVAEAKGDASNGSVAVIWHDLPDALGATTATREQVVAATRFKGGEGCCLRNGIVYFTTKGDNRIWAYDTANQLLDVLYDDDRFADPILRGVDNIIATPGGHLLVAEDGDDMQVVVIGPAGPGLQLAPLAQLPGDQGGSEITGLALSPDGKRLYFNSQRGGDIKLPVPALIAGPLGLPVAGEVGGGKLFEIRREDGKPIF